MHCTENENHHFGDEKAQLKRELSSGLLSQQQLDAVAIKLSDCRLYAPVVFDLLSHDPQEDTAVNCLTLLSLLVPQRGWNAVAGKSIEKKGRCPHRYRQVMKKVFRRQINDVADIRQGVQCGLKDIEDHASTTDDNTTDIKHDRRHVIARHVERTIRLSAEDTGIHQWNLANALGGDVPSRLTLDFSDSEHTYINGLTSIVSYVRKHNIPTTIRCTPATKEYLARIRFLDAVSSTQDNTISLRDMDNRYNVVIQPISGIPAEKIAHSLVEVIRKHVQHIQLDYNTIEILFAELIENIDRHAGKESVGYVGAQIYAKQNKLGIAVADCGIGIRKSFEDGSNKEAKARISRGESPLTLACTPLITSKPHASHAGYGLYVANEVVIRNGGTFCLTSGDETMTRYMQKIRRHVKIAKHAAWFGTWIGMILDLNKPIAIKDVYATMPEVKGYSQEDFFL